MYIASILVHALFGVVLAFLFTLLYVKIERKWSIFIDFLLIGSGGNIGAIFILDKLFDLKDTTLRMCSIASLIATFVLATIGFLALLAYVVNDNENLLPRDIILGKSSWIDKYYDKRAKEIDEHFNVKELEEREAKITKNEAELAAQEKFLKQEFQKLDELSSKKPRLKMPEKRTIVLKPEFLESMPSYMNDMVKCINNINAATKSLLSKDSERIDITILRSSFLSIATTICGDIFGQTTKQVRIHFRVYDIVKDGYAKFVAVSGSKIITQDMTFIPYAVDNMINRSYKCKRALIKSINEAHDYKSRNHMIWTDYMTYTFYGLEIGNKPFLSFGISIKDATRYRDILRFLNYFRLESFLQDNIEQVNEHVNISNILYGGSSNA